MFISRGSKQNFTTKELYQMTKSPEIMKMSTAVDTVLDVAEWCLRIDEAPDQEEQARILSILTPENEVYATNSKTFIREFLDIADIFAADGIPVRRVKIASGRSRAGRQFITAVAVFD